MTEQDRDALQERAEARRIATEALRKRAVQLRAEGLTQAVIAERLRVSRALVACWLSTPA